MPPPVQISGGDFEVVTSPANLKGGFSAGDLIPWIDEVSIAAGEFGIQAPRAEVAGDFIILTGMTL
ncbi:MAG: hypothetical protein AMXMBFR84_36020 [Candidatus Hydrogenedentota bacterium]